MPHYSVDSDKSAKKIRNEIKKNTGKQIAVIISDTLGRPLRMGQTNCAIGISGMNAILDYTGKSDSFGNVLRVTAIAVADELASAAELVMKKSTNCPIAIIRGYTFEANNGTVDTLFRSESMIYLDNYTTPNQSD